MVVNTKIKRINDFKGGEWDEKKGLLTALPNDQNHVSWVFVCRVTDKWYRCPKPLRLYINGTHTTPTEKIKKLMGFSCIQFHLIAWKYSDFGFLFVVCVSMYGCVTLFFFSCRLYCHLPIGYTMEITHACILSTKSAAGSNISRIRWPELIGEYCFSFGWFNAHLCIQFE